ncbi:uncharacterized protein [Chelonus insularis]|uniref:uncharacterized protein n=1 Tax=Chelonus insularis TaxID=460826 RepID=UPI00158AF860|nr:uncharacterized protein LOC118073427 [Chelonus insularis]
MQENNHSACGCLQLKAVPHSSRYYREIGAKVIGNELLIKFEKKTNTPDNYDPPCYCKNSVSTSTGFQSQPPATKIIGVGDNQLTFQISPKFEFNYDNNPHYKSSVITDDQDFENDGRIKVLPHMDGLGPNHQVTHHYGSEDDHNSYMMKIQRIKSDSIKDQKQNRRNIEVEIAYPKKKVPKKK